MHAWPLEGIFIHVKSVNSVRGICMHGHKVDRQFTHVRCESITEGIYISMHGHRKNHVLLEVELFHLLISMLCKLVIQSFYRISLKFLISSCNIISLSFFVHIQFLQ